MEESVLTAVFLPLALAFIMIGMGLSLRPSDFKQLFAQPKAVFLGLICQLLLLPLVAAFFVMLFDLSGALAVGLMILAACPGGATSNLISHLAKGDTALSISLTAFSSLVTVFTIPLIVNYSISFFGESGAVTLPFWKTVLQIVVITIVPVGIGMFIKGLRPSFADRADTFVRLVSALFLVAIILAAIVKERDHLVEYFLLMGPATLGLNVAMLVLGFLVGRAFRLSARQGVTLAIESGIQNGTLGIVVAASLLQNSTMTIPSAIYSLVMFGTAAFVIIGSNRLRRTSEQKI